MANKLKSKNGKIKKPVKFRSLTFTLSVAFLLLTSVVLFVTTGLETYSGFKTQQQAITVQEQLIAQSAVDAVQNFIKGKINLLQTAVVLDHQSPLHLMKPSMEKMMSVDLAFRQVVLFDSARQELVRVSRSSKISAAQVMEMDNDGVFSMIEKGESYMGPIYIDKVSNEPIVIMAVPVKNVFGDIEGALVAEVNLKFMWELVGHLKVGKNGLAYVIDKQGTLIAFGEVGRVLKEENLSSLKEVSDFVSGKEKKKDDLVTFSKGILGTTVVSYYAPLDLTDWAAVVELPATEAYAGAINQIKFTLFIIILIIIIDVGLAVYLSRKITGPIISLRNATERISKGKMNTRAEIRSNDEIGDLAENFNKMAEEIQARTKKLSEGLGRLQSLVESVKLGVVMVDLNLNVILSNSAANKMLGMPADGMISFNDLSGKVKGSVDISQALSYYVNTGTPLNIQEVLIDDKFFRLFMSPVRDITDKIFIGAVVIMEDITEQKKLDKMRTEIVSITSHQLRTPSTIIKGNLEMLANPQVGELNGSQKELLDDTRMGNERMISLINDLMDVAKIDEGKFKLEVKPAQLEDLVSKVVKILMPLAKERNVILDYNHPQSPLPPVMVNAGRVEQIIQNISDNALKYSSGRQDGRVVVSIIEGAKFLEFVVKDNGIGIPEGEQGKIFERFSRGSNSTKLDPGGGSGLGLYIAKAVVEQGGGRIWFESKENEGTTFHATFPYA